MGLSWGNSIRDFKHSVDLNIKAVNEETQTAVDKTAAIVFRDAKQNTPQRTGRLKSSWRKLTKGYGKKRRVLVLNNVPYAPFVEYGTIVKGVQRMAPKYMLRKAEIKGNKYLTRQLKVIKRRASQRF